jgi:hypothetical protein
MIFPKSAGAGNARFDHDWAAELTMAAYAVALRHGAPNSWLDLQLELWRALSARVAKCGREFFVRRERGEAGFPVEEFLADLADLAYRIALPYAPRRSFLDLELALYQTFRRSVEDAQTEWAALNGRCAPA